MQHALKLSTVFINFKITQNIKNVIVRNNLVKLGKFMFCLFLPPFW